jgi:hypothetical protein
MTVLLQLSFFYIGTLLVWNNMSWHT